MARNFIKIDEWEDWIPDIDGERELYAGDPSEALVMELRFLTKEQREHYQRMSEKYKRLGATSTADERSVRELFAENVRNVRNYTVSGVAIADGAGVYDVDGDERLKMAVVGALFDRSTLDAGLAKKLRSGSDMKSSHRRSKSSGAALGAIPASPATTLGESARIPSYVSPTPTSDEIEVVMARPPSSTTGGSPDSSDVPKAS